MQLPHRVQELVSSFNKGLLAGIDDNEGGEPRADDDGDDDDDDDRDNHNDDSENSDNDDSDGKPVTMV